jgi:hypothetical protein
MFVAQVHMGNPSFVRFRLSSDEYLPRPSCPTGDIFLESAPIVFVNENSPRTTGKASWIYMHDTKHLQYYLKSVTDWQDRGVEIFESRPCLVNQLEILNNTVNITYFFLCPFLVHDLSPVTRLVSPVELVLCTFPGHLRSDSPPILSGVRVAQSLVLCVVFCRSLLVCF